MKLKIFSLLVSFLCISVTLTGQTGLVSGNLDVTVFPTNLGGGKFLVDGTFSDPKGQWFASDVDSGMVFWKGNNMYLIDSIITVSGPNLTIRVQDTYSTGFIPTGTAYIVEKTPKGIPGVSVTGDSNPSLATPPDYAAGVNNSIRKIDSLLLSSVDVASQISDSLNWVRDTTQNIRADLEAARDSFPNIPSGTGTNLRIPVWTGTASLGNSTLLQSATGQTLDANLAFRITGGTTASRPTGAAGMWYYDTSNNWFDFHNGTSWFNPARSAYSTGLYTSARVPFSDANGLLADASNFTYNSSTSHLFAGLRLNVGGTSPTWGLSNYTTSASASNFATNNAVLLALTNTNASNNQFTSVFFGTAAQGNAAISSQKVTSISADLRFYTRNTAGSFPAQPNLFVSTEGLVGIATASPDRLLHPELSGSATTTAGYPARFSHITSATAAAGFGTRLELEAENASGANRIIGDFGSVYTTATNAAEVSDFVISTMRAGTLTESLRSLGNGTLQVGTLSGTVTQMVGATAGNILTTFSPGYGLAFASGALRADTTALKAQFLPLTLSGTTTVNTAGQTLRFRDAGGYPNIQMTSAYGIIESDANTYFLAGFPTVGTARAQAAELMVISAGAGGAVEIEADSIVIDATLPANTNATSVLVRDAVTKRVEEKAISALETRWMKTELDAGNTVSISGDNTNVFEINDLFDITFQAANYVEFIGGTQCGITSAGNAFVNSGAGGIDINADGGTEEIRLNGTVKLQAGTDNGAADFIAGYVDSILTQVEIGAGVELSAGTLQTTQCFGYNSEALVALTAVTATADTIFAADDLSPCNFTFDVDTGSYTYTGETRYFKATIAGQVIGEGNGEYASFTLYKNASPTAASSQTTLEIDPINFNAQAVVQLASGDVVNVRVLTTDPGGENFYILNYSLIITEI